MRRWIGAVSFLMCLFFVGSPAWAKYTFFDGNDWRNIESYRLAQSDELMVKKVLLKSVFEVSLFNNVPILEVKTVESDFPVYVQMINTFYSKPENRSLPLYFALRIAGMQKSGLSAEEISQFAQLITAKLKQEGFL